MLYRKFAAEIEDFLDNEPDKILLVNGARQIGKSYIIRYVCKKRFHNYVEINLKEDKEGIALFEKVKSTDQFYIQLSLIAGDKLGNKNDTIIFLDEIQAYPHLLTMLKFLRQEGRFSYIASGSQLGIALAETPSVPIGSIAQKQMYPLDFEEFLIASGVGKDVLDLMRESFKKNESLNESLHNFIMQMFKYYFIVGGMPDAVNQFIKDRNIRTVRSIQKNIIDLYKTDASQYDISRKLVIRKIYDLIPSTLENKKKRIVFRDVENNKQRQYEDYIDEFEYLTNSGVAIAVNSVSNPKFPLIESQRKNLLKLYLNDVGLLTALLYDLNINAILNDETSINAGTVYESVVAQELKAHGFPLYYYDNKKNGEVDYLIDDFNSLSVLPLEVKSGKDYTVHSALNKFITNDDYNITSGVVLSNTNKTAIKNAVSYMPVYYVMFFKNTHSGEFITLPDLTIPDIL